jgi:hypothetical protein
MRTAVVVGEEDYDQSARHRTPLECPDVIADVPMRLLPKETI